MLRYHVFTGLEEVHRLSLYHLEAFKITLSHMILSRNVTPVHCLQTGGCLFITAEEMHLLQAHCACSTLTETQTPAFLIYNKKKTHFVLMKLLFHAYRLQISRQLFFFSPSAEKNSN